MAESQKLHYMDVPVGAIVESLRSMATYIRDNISSVDIKETLDTWELEKPYEEIAGAKTPKEAEIAILKTQTAGFLRGVHDILAFQALSQKDASTEKNAGFDIYKNIAAWGGFDFLTEEPADSLKLEADSYLNAAYVKAINPKDLQASSGAGLLSKPKASQRFLHQCMKFVAQADNKAAANQKLLKYTSDWQQFLNVGLQMDTHTAAIQFSRFAKDSRQMIQNFTEAALGLKTRREILKNLSPIQTYTIKPAKPGQAPKEQGQKLNRIIDTVKDTAINKAEQGHLRDISITRPADKNDVDFTKIGVVVHATKTLAETIARAHADFRVTDSLGRAVGGSASDGPSSKKGPRP